MGGIYFIAVAILITGTCYGSSVYCPVEEPDYTPCKVENDSCTVDETCPEGQVCCKHRCGKVCKPRAGRCQQPIVKGPCEQYEPSYGYNHLKGMCQKFIYSGCGGNENRFKSSRDCYTACSK